MNISFPDSLPLDFLATENFFPYKDHGKLSEDTRVSFDNIDVFKEVQKGIYQEYKPLHMPQGDAKVFFSEDHWIYLPPKESILRQKREDQESWVFPEGTIFAHCLYFKENPERLMECRLEGLTNEGWKYAVYTPSQDRDKLFLTQYPDRQTLAHSFRDPKLGPLLIQTTALSPRDCVRCHSLETDHGSTPLPCGFKPGLISTSAPWVERFRERFGFGPFTASPPEPTSSP